MNKSILVIDTPESCRDCVLRGKDMDIDICGVTGRVICDEIIDRVISQYCSLKPLPQKYEIDKSKCSDPFYEFEFEYGYNQCIDEIMGE